MKPVERLDPEIAKAIEMIPFSEMTAETAAMMRSLSFEMPLSDVVERTDHVVPGAPEVPVRVHRPKNGAGSRPCLFSMHGGGYVIGDYFMDDPMFDELGHRLCTSAAEQDDRPDEFDIDRPPSVAVSLGHGVHSCLGAALARVESRVAIEELARRGPSFGIDESGLRRVQMSNVAGYSNVPVNLS